MLIRKIHESLIEKGKTLSLAESLTGGLLSYSFVKWSGCSAYFKGSLVAYSAAAKQEILKVNGQTLEKFGEVSIETAQEMAEGALQLFHTDYSCAVTGIAGPTGATDKKPVGLVAIAIGIKNKPTISITKYFQGMREEIIKQTISTAHLLLSEGIND